MNNEENEFEKMNERMERLMLEVMCATKMAKFAPKDDKGNYVVDIAKIDGIGFFYLFKN